MNLAGVKNIIFDLGGVIIDIDPQRTYQAFKELSKQYADAKDFSEKDIFIEIETGLIGEEIFRNTIRTYIGPVTDEQIDAAWNALLLDLPVERLDVIRNLKTDYRLILLSNTNEIHIREIMRRMASLPEYYAFDNLFDQQYYSHRVKMRKPSKEIYQLIVDELNINPEETIFIDDIFENAMAAESVGIKGCHLDLSKHDLVKFIADVRK